MKSINLKIRNNTSTTQNVSLLGVVPDPNSANNINNLYQFDLTGQSYVGIVSVSITYAPTSTLFYTTVSVPVTNQSIQGVVDALNTLNIGIFTLSGNIISVGSNTYVYQNITFGLPFVSSWDTTITSGTSTANNQVQLPLNVLGTYNFFIDWGDGTQNIITSWNQPEILHTYATAGIYTITMTGLISEWSFGDALFNLGVSDSEKMLSISSWGDLQFGTTLTFQSFYQCTNLDLTFVSDLPNLSNTLYLDGCFSDCTSLTAINRSNEWNTSNVVNMVAMFSNSPNFNSDITTWNTSNVTDMNAMFQNASAFNQAIGSWNVSNVTNMNAMFNSATAFNQNIGSWNISNVTSFINFMSGKTDLDYSSANLDSIYNNWSLLSVQPNLTADFGTIKYTAGASAGRLILTSAPNNWIINDGGI
jgi:surface protein